MEGEEAEERKGGSMQERELCTQNKSSGIWTVGLPRVFVHFLPPHFPLTLLKKREKKKQTSLPPLQTLKTFFYWMRSEPAPPPPPKQNDVLSSRKRWRWLCGCVLLMKNAVNGVSQQGTFPGARQPRSFVRWAVCHGKEMARRRKGGHFAPPPEDF